MCVPRSHGVGSKQGNLGRSARIESCNTKWFGQSVEAACKHNQAMSAKGTKLGNLVGGAFIPVCLSVSHNIQITIPPLPTRNSNDTQTHRTRHSDLQASTSRTTARPTRLPLVQTKHSNRTRPPSRNRPRRHTRRRIRCQLQTMQLCARSNLPKPKTSQRKAKP